MTAAFKILSTLFFLIALSIAAGVLLEPYYQNQFTRVASGLKTEAVVFALISIVITQAEIIRRGPSK